MSAFTSYRTPLALLVASSVVTGAALVANDAENTALSTSPAGTWLPNDATDSVTRVGPAGADSTIALLDPVGRLDVLTIDGQVYVTDESGQVSRLDLALLDVAAEQDLPDDVQLVGGADRVYAVDPGADSVQELDPWTLEPIGAPVLVGGTVGDAVVDDAGLLWIVDLSTGAVLVIDGSRIVDRHLIGVPAADLDLLVSELGTVVIDRTEAEIVIPDDRSYGVELSGSGRVASPDSTNGSPIVPILDGSVLLLVDLTDGSVRRVDLAVNDHDLGVPQLTSTRVIIPDHTTGSLLLVSLESGELLAEVALPDPPTSFDVVVDGDVAYVNDRDSERVWMIRPDGELVERRKYDPNGDGVGFGGADQGDDGDAVSTEDDDVDADDESEPDEDDDERPDIGDGAAVVVPRPPARPAEPAAGDLPPRPPVADPPAATPPAATPSTTVPTSEPDGTPSEPLPTDPPSVNSDGVTDVVVTRTNAGGAVSWAVPAGWLDLTGITVEVVDAAGVVVSGATIGPDARSYSVNGLANGSVYRFTITMRRGGQTGATVRSAEFVPGVAGDGAPAGVVATAGDETVTVAWSPPVDWFDVDQYLVEIFLADGSTSPVDVETVGAGERLFTSFGRTNDVAHIAAVTPLSADGEGRTIRSQPVTPIADPVAGDGRPSIGAVVAGTGTATLDWVAPADWYVVTGYQIVAVAADGTRLPQTAVAGSSTTATATGLTNGVEYTIELTAQSAQGPGPTVASDPVTPIGDGAVRALAVAPSDGRATVTWNPPAGWRPVTGYRLTVSPGGIDLQLAPGTTRRDLTSLTNGTAYTVTVTALSAAGPGADESVGPFTAAADLPGAPTITSSSAGAGSVTIGWAAPTTGNWDDYRVTVTPADGSPATVETIAATRTSHEVRNLTNGVVHDVSVAAVHPGGTPGAAATVTGLVPRSVPSRPPVGSAQSDATGTAVTLTWAAPGVDGGSPITEYVIDGQVVGGAAVLSGRTVAAGQTSFTVTGLTPGALHRFTITARNAIGSSPTNTWADVRTNVPQPDPPSAPQAFSASGGDGEATLSWSAPATNPGDVTQYAIVLNGEERRVGAGTTSYRWTGLTNGTTYTFTISAVAAVGSGPSASDSAVPSGAPAAPTGLTAGPIGQTSFGVSWTQASPSNGTAVTSWTVSVNGGAASSVSSASYSANGLSASTTYTVTVRAVGANGLQSGAATISVTTLDPPPPPPGAITGLFALAEAGFVSIQWDATPGATSYEYRIDNGPWQSTTGTFAGGTTGGGGGTVSVRAVNASGTGPIATTGYVDLCDRGQGQQICP